MNFPKLFLLCVLSVSVLSGCTFQPEPNQTASPEVSVEEFFVVSDAVAPPHTGDFEFYIPHASKNNPKLSSAEQAELYDPQISPFGFNLAVEEKFNQTIIRLFHQNTLLLEHIRGFSNLSFDADQQHFVMRLWTREGIYLLSNTTEPYLTPANYDIAGPIYAGNQLLTAQINYDHKLDDLNQKWLYPLEVKAGHEIIFSTQVEVNAVQNRIFLTDWDNNWVLECKDLVFINGDSLNEERGKQKIFNWTTINKSPFYFYQNSGTDSFYSFHFAGMDYETYQYDDILHNACCGVARLNPIINQNVVIFFALKDGDWYMVRIEIK